MRIEIFKGRAVLTLAVILMFALATLWAVHDLGLFELEGNIVDDIVAGDDWQSLFDDPDVLLSSEIAKAFVHDGSNERLDAGGVDVDTTYFFGGGSKDIHDIPSWGVNGDVAPAKDELVNVMAAVYVVPAGPQAGDLIFYFAADRWATNGDSQIGIWILQDDVAVSGAGFTGIHIDNDLLVLSDFLKGGGVSSVKVFQWLGGAPVDVTPAATGDCAVALPLDAACATVNDISDGVLPIPASVISEWTYEPKFGPAGSYQVGSFFEGGINLTTFGLEGCLSSFLMETRSSQSINAQLKDFALGQISVCDAKIEISPPTDTNEFDEEHILTITVMKKDSSTGFVFGPAENVLVTASFDDNGAGASFKDDINTCTTDAAGECTVTIIPTTTGTTVVIASADVDVQGQDEDIAVSTDGEAPNSGPAEKIWVDAEIIIQPDGANEVGTAHGFMVFVNADAGDGNGMQPVEDAQPTVTITPIPDSVIDLCLPPPAEDGTDANGKCTVTINNNTADTFVANASVTLTVGGLSVDRDTDPATTEIPPGPGGSGPATKVYADGSISILPDDTNNITESHTFTVMVMENDGSDGFTPVLGVNPIVTIVPTPDSVVDNCASGGTDVLGKCTVVISNDTAGVFVANASLNWNVGTSEGDVNITRSTSGNSGPGGTGPATKTYVDGMLSWIKHDNLGNLLGGATFEVCRTHTFNSDTTTMDDTPDVCVSVTDNSPPDANAADGLFKLNNLVLGRYTITETAAPPPNFILDPTPQTVDIAISTPPPNGSASLPFVNTVPDQGCTPGFWKNHLDEWTSTGLNPTDSFLSAFGVEVTGNPGLTLEQAINLGGGGFNKLARHGVAALLNALSPSVNALTPAQVIALVVSGMADDGTPGEPEATQLAAANNPPAGCPLS